MARQFIRESVDTVNKGYRVAGAMLLVVGMPNVGKSSLINSVRTSLRSTDRKVKSRGANKPARTGARPGVTRHLSAIQVSTIP